MSNFEHFLSTKKVYLKKLTKKIIFNELFYNCISSTVIYIKKPSIWWPEKYFSHDKMQFFGIFRNYETKFCSWSFGNTIEIMVLIGRLVLTMHTNLSFYKFPEMAERFLAWGSRQWMAFFKMKILGQFYLVNSKILGKQLFP